MRTLLGVGLLTVSVIIVLLLRPNKGRERRFIQLPGMWIVLGLLLTFSIGTAVALIVTGIINL